MTIKKQPKSILIYTECLGRNVKKKRIEPFSNVSQEKKSLKDINRKDETIKTELGEIKWVDEVNDIDGLKYESSGWLIHRNV